MYEKLKEMIYAKDMTIFGFCAKTGMERTTLFRKTRNETPRFTLEELRKIADVLELSGKEILDLFFEGKEY